MPKLALVVIRGARRCRYACRDEGKESGMKALLFDMDGVLVESLAAYRDAWTNWAAAYGVSLAAIASDVHGRRPEEVIERVLPGAPAGVLEAFDGLLDAGLPLVLGIPGARDLTAQLPPRQWAIVTSGSRRHVVPMLEYAGIAPPGVVVCGDDITRGKPDPQCFLRAAELLGVAPADCCVVEDAPAGIEAALAGGMEAIAVATTHLPEQLSRAGRVFPSLAQASGYLLALTGDGAKP